ncbi:hypothetical protein [Aerolutibacter ruishenii]|uniref:Putative transposase n=1 Tax=Aerolutibacter ruishenii TaxID=686800 RepID=A0A562M0R1_9GAMM|nr:hypothetical protein [Lysobacter ruishenii]TWI13534.1 putative transposase [Lysobacter ruishenii]
MTEEEARADSHSAAPFADGTLEPVEFSYETPTEKLSVEIRMDLYHSLALNTSQIATLEEMIAASPARVVGDGALKNVRTAYFSAKNAGLRHTESHTCEQVYAYLLELDPDVLGYYTQVQCRGVERRSGDRRHITSSTLDFLVFRKDSIQLVECKTEEWLLRHTTKKPEYQLVDGEWKHEAFSNWAEAQGIEFSVYAQNSPFGIHLQNLEACCALVDAPLSDAELAICARVEAKLKQGTTSLEAMSRAIPKFNGRLALWMVANRKSFAALRTTSPLEPATFWIFPTELQAQEADRRAYSEVAQRFSQPVVTDPLLRASATAMEAAKQRLRRLEDIEQGKSEPTRATQSLAKQLATKCTDGMSPVAVAIPNFHLCGNRQGRLLPLQEEALAVVVAQWNKGLHPSQVVAWLALQNLCEKQSVPTPSAETLRKRLKKQDPTKRALTTGGIRQYQAAKPRAGSDVRSLPPMGYGYKLIIDSSGLDNRCAPNILTQFPAEKPRFYIGIDAATGDSMACAFVFGPASTYALAILLRDYVLRHGFLPKVIQADRGPENTSEWLKVFCKQQGISLCHPPTGGSRFNGQAENTIKQVNTQVSHRLAGSSEPDSIGRKVDGRFKSYQTAKHTFEELYGEFRAFVFDDLPQTPDGEGFTPAEKREYVLNTVGSLGIPCAYDDAFLIKTAISLAVPKRATERDGIRTGYGYYTSEGLQRALRTGVPTEVRQDCVDPSVLYVKVQNVWWKGFHKTAQTLALNSEPARIFALLRRSKLSRDAAKARLEVKATRHNRQAAMALESRPATDHVAPKAASDFQDREVVKTKAGKSEKREPIDWAAVESY